MKFCRPVSFATAVVLLCSNAAPSQTVAGYVTAAQVSNDQAASRISEPGLVHFPVASRTHIAFVHANQIWIERRDSSEAATQLTNVPGPKYRLAFSPDGQTLAFTANLDANPNIYTVPITGGEPKRITYLPFNVTLCQWTARDELLFYTDSLSFSFLAMQLFTVPASGGPIQKLAVPYGSEASLNSDGEWLAYTPYWPQTNLRQIRKRYLGGIAPDIWLFNRRTNVSKKITSWAGSDTRPIWHGNTIYYISDAGTEHRLNIWTYDTLSGQRRQVTFFTDYDINNPSMNVNGDGEIIFQLGADIWALNLSSAKSHKIEINLPITKDLRRDVNAAKFVTSSELASNGENIFVAARGDVWSVPTRGSAPKNLTHTSGIFERNPSVSPNSQWLAYFSDASGEYELYVQRSDGSERPRRLTSLGPGFRYLPTWSPDSQLIAFTDKKGGIFIQSASGGSVQRIDVDDWSQQANIAWSADSRMLSYTRTGENRRTSLWLYDLTTKVKHQVTSGKFNDFNPVFDKRGDYLFFVSNRNFTAPIFDSQNRSFAYSSTSMLMAVPLRENLISPITADASPRSATAAPEIPIDVEGFERRETILSTERGTISNLDATNSGNPIYAHTSRAGTNSIRLIDLASDKKDEKIVVDGEADFQLSADGKKALVRKPGELFVIDSIPQQKLTAGIKLEQMSTSVDLREEWHQIFDDIWRLYRDFFYAPNMHGVDWQRARERYQPLLARAVSREDLNYVISEMIAELNVSHAWIQNPGDVERRPTGTVAMLGADFSLQNGAYRIQRLYEGASWDPGARNPLSQASVREGEYILAVNGVALDVNRDFLASIQNQAGKEIALTVSNQPVKDQTARQVRVKPLSDDANLRYRSWVEKNRMLVENQSKGEIGYVHVPDASFNGLNELIKQYGGQTNKRALIVDIRWSQGGFLGDTFAHLLDQPGLNYFAERDSTNNWPVTNPILTGPKCLLINHLVVSAGENFAYFFRRLGLGKLVGMRTWGGLVGLNGNPSLIDGGYVNVPNAGFFSAEGQWLIENHGIDPDLEVVDDPALMLNEEDPQLNAAIKLMLDEIKRVGLKPPTRPASPTRAIIE